MITLRLEAPTDPPTIKASPTWHTWQAILDLLVRPAVVKHWRALKELAKLKPQMLGPKQQLRVRDKLWDFRYAPFPLRTELACMELVILLKPPTAEPMTKTPSSDAELLLDLPRSCGQVARHLMTLTIFRSSRPRSCSLHACWYCPCFSTSY